jgi:hypothetical protein
MALLALVAIGLLGDGFMLYALLQWMRDDRMRTAAKAANLSQIVFIGRNFSRTGQEYLQTPGKDRDCAPTLGYIQNAGRNVRVEGGGRNVRAREVKGTTTGRYRARRLHDLQPNHWKENRHPA